MDNKELKQTTTAIACIIAVSAVIFLFIAYGQMKNAPVLYQYNSINSADVGVNSSRVAGREIEYNGLVCISLSEEDQITINENIKELTIKYSELVGVIFSYGVVKADNGINSLFVGVRSQNIDKISATLVSEFIHLFATNNIMAEYDAIEVALVDDEGNIYDSFGMNDVKNMIDEINN